MRTLQEIELDQMQLSHPMLLDTEFDDYDDAVAYYIEEDKEAA